MQARVASRFDLKHTAEEELRRREFYYKQSSTFNPIGAVRPAEKSTVSSVVEWARPEPYLDCKPEPWRHCRRSLGLDALLSSPGSGWSSEGRSLTDSCNIRCGSRSGFTTPLLQVRTTDAKSMTPSIRRSAVQEVSGAGNDLKGTGPTDTVTGRPAGRQTQAGRAPEGMRRRTETMLS